MRNFDFYNPTKILFGKGKIGDIKNEIPEGSKVMVTYGGGSIKQNGVYDQVAEALRTFDWTSFGGIEPNPRYETCMKAVEKVKEEKVDFLLAVGGGSVYDGTKFIAAAAFFEGNPWDILARRASVSKTLPLAGVLTLPATGSEMNSGAVITREETHEKLPFSHPLLFPKFSVLDPSVTASLSSRQTANGVVDAFVHVMEQYMTYPTGNHLQARFAESILSVLIEEGPEYYRHPADYEKAANIMWSATMALNGLVGAGVPNDWSTHMIGHELTAFHEIDHARTLAIVLPGTWHVLKEDKKERLKQYAERVWLITEGSDEEKADKAIAKTEEFFNSLGIKTHLSDYDVGESTIQKIVNRFEERRWFLGEKQKVGPENVEKILRSRA